MVTLALLGAIAASDYELPCWARPIATTLATLDVLHSDMAQALWRGLNGY